MVELPGIKEPERVRKLLQGSANLEFWETYEASEIVPILASADNRARDILSVSESADSVEVKAESTAAVSAKDSLTAALKGETAEASVNMEQLKKEHPLLSVLRSSVEPEWCRLYRRLC